MRIAIGSLAAVAATGLLTISFAGVAYGQDTNCVGANADCAISETPVPGVRIVRPQNYFQRPTHYMSGDLYTTLAQAKETRNRFAMVDLLVPPGGGPAAHTHDHEWETFFVVQGTVNFFMGVNPNPPFNVIEQPLPPGTAVYAPRCRIMGFTNRSNALARVLSFALPAGIDNLFHLVGDEVVHRDAPLLPATPEQFLRQTFWGEREGDKPYFPGLQPPPDCPGVPLPVISSITGVGRPLEVGPFGETRVVLVSPTEVGVATGATAFCGGGAPNRPGGTVKYASFSLPNRSGFPPPYISPFTEVVYVLTGRLTFLFDNNRSVDVDPMTYVEIQPGVVFSLANFSGSSAVPAQALSITVIGPQCSQ